MTEKFELKAGECAIIIDNEGLRLVMPKLGDDEEVSDAVMMSTMIAVFIKTPEAIDIVQKKIIEIQECREKDKSN